ncbi:MAG: pyridoxal phosphate-dependent aminotransferase [Polyangiales bacterium]
MPHFSSRATFSARPNPLTEALSRRVAAGLPVLDLTESNPTRAGLAPGDAALAAALTREGIGSYAPEPFGLASARMAISAELAAAGFAVPPAQVMLTASTSEAYAYLFRLLCDPGDSVLVPSPSYPLFDVLAQLEQVQLVPYPLAYDGTWHVDVAALRDAVGPRTRAVITVHPNNPTGSFLAKDELRALAALGLPIVSDEVFAEYAFAPDPRRATSALEAHDALVFRLGGLSKACALPQLKLAWTAVAGPGADDACARLEHLADAFLSPSTPVQHALPSLLALGAEVRAGILARIATNRRVLARTVANGAASLLHAEGGWYAVLRLPAVRDDEHWALTLLDEDGLLVQPGYYYDLHRGAHLVLSLICPEAAFAEGVARLARRVSADAPSG